MKSSSSLTLTRYESQKALSTMKLEDERVTVESDILQFELLKTPADNFRSYSRSDLISMHKKCVDPSSSTAPLPLTLTKRLEASLKLANSSSAPVLASGNRTLPSAGNNTSNGNRQTANRQATVATPSQLISRGGPPSKSKPGTSRGPEEGSLEAMPTKAAVLEKCMSTFGMLKAKPTAWFNDITIDETSFARVEIYGSDRGIAEIVLLKRAPSIVFSKISGSVSDFRNSFVGIGGYSIEGDPSSLPLEGSTISNAGNPSGKMSAGAILQARASVVHECAASIKGLNSVIDAQSSSLATGDGSRGVSFGRTLSENGIGRQNSIGLPSSARSVETAQRSIIKSSSADESLGSSVVTAQGASQNVVSSTLEPPFNPSDYIEVGRLVLTRDKVQQYQLPIPPAQAVAKEFDQFFSDMDNGPTSEELRDQWSDWFKALQYLLKIVPYNSGDEDRFEIELKPPFVPVTMAGRKWDLAFPPKKVEPARPGRLPSLQNNPPKVKLDSRKVYLFFRDT